MKQIRRRWKLGLLGLMLIGLCLLMVLRKGAAPLLLAPMMRLTQPCMLAAPNDPSCRGSSDSAAALVEATLSRIGPRVSPSGKYELGYTLQVPLLQLLQPIGNDWVVNIPAVQRLVRTLRDVDRPAVLYLFSTHFGIEAPIQDALAQDPANLATTPQGPMPNDTYDGMVIYPWSVARTDNEITGRRAQVISALIEEVCRLEPAHWAKIRGITLLGEVHHLFPGFEAGMGFDEQYSVSDYSEISMEGFRSYLSKYFSSIDKLNSAMATDYRSFAEVLPPSKNIRQQALQRFTEHIDSYAHGSLPVSGWVHVEKSRSDSPTWIRLYLNGDPVARVNADLGRQDVLAALPKLGTADVGWRFDLDFSSIPTGVHRIDVVLESGASELLHLGTRLISVMDRQQTQPEVLATNQLPVTSSPGKSVQFYIDTPRDKASYFYNPLVPLWHKFRQRQLVDYLTYFDRLIEASCISKSDRYVHQIVPFTNPGWDAQKFAVEATLESTAQLHLGVSLYGESSYGHSFLDWYRKSGHQSYGVTEFHPLRAMAPAELRATLDAHRAQGARFLSFFMESRWQSDGSSTDRNRFSFDVDNPTSGSDKLFQSMKAVLSE